MKTIILSLILAFILISCESPTAPKENAKPRTQTMQQVRIIK